MLRELVGRGVLLGVCKEVKGRGVLLQRGSRAEQPLFPEQILSPTLHIEHLLCQTPSTVSSTLYVEQEPSQSAFFTALEIDAPSAMSNRPVTISLYPTGGLWLGRE
jgi:hypothetical protein